MIEGRTIIANGVDTLTLDVADLMRKLDAANAKIAAMQAQSQRKLTLKVSDKGALSLYGLGRFPVTLYVGQWERLIAEVEHIKGFIEANRGLLSVKD